MSVPFGTLIASSPPVVGGTYQCIMTPSRNGDVWDVTGLACTLTFTRPDGTTFTRSGTVIAAPAPYNSASDPKNPTGRAYVTVVSYNTVAGSTPDLNQPGQWVVDCEVAGGGVDIWFGQLGFVVAAR